MNPKVNKEEDPLNLIKTLAIVSLLTVPMSVVAIELQPPSNAPFNTPGEVLTKLYDVGITMAAIVFVILFLVGGIQYLTTAGDTDGTGKAKKLLVDAIIGLVLVLAAWALSDFILGQLTDNTSGGTNSQGTVNNPQGGLPTPPQATER